MTLTPIRPDTAAVEMLAVLNDRDAFARHQERNLRPETVRELGRKIEEAGVEYVYYALPTIGSRMVAKMVPANHFRRNLEKGICFHRTALSDLQNDRYGNLIGGGIEAREFWALPEPDTFVVLPWDTKVARIFCTAYEPPHLPEVGGRLMPVDTRSLLIRSHEAFTARTGFEVRSGTEPEMTWEGPGLEVVKKPGTSPAYQVENLERMRPIYKQLITYATAMGLDMIEGDYEDDGQLELNWMYDRVENTADRLVTYRQICKQVAREFGVTASFMPKPYNGQMGNGCHHNLSLWDGDTNVIEDAGRVELHVSETAKHAIGGPARPCTRVHGRDGLNGELLQTLLGRRPVRAEPGQLGTGQPRLPDPHLLERADGVPRAGRRSEPLSVPHAAHRRHGGRDEPPSRSRHARRPAPTARSAASCR